LYNKIDTVVRWRLENMELSLRSCLKTLLRLEKLFFPLGRGMGFSRSGWIIKRMTFGQNMFHAIVWAHAMVIVALVTGVSQVCSIVSKMRIWSTIELPEL
jgi:hypothetical protein